LGQRAFLERAYAILGGIMQLASRIVVGLIALLHAYFLVLEMFLWQSQVGYSAFGTTPEFAAASATLAANQGLYNGFLSAGLLWGLLHRNRAFAWQIQAFFLGCVAVAGIYGAATVKPAILVVQTIPAVIGLVLVLLARRTSSASSDVSH
jgi:putative membrane protein